MKPENKGLFKLILALLFMSSIMGYGQNRVKKDIYGRDILDSNGKGINYSKNDIIPTSQNLIGATLQLKSTKVQQSNCIKDTVNAKIDNLFSVMGTSIGRNSMHSIDIDNDSIVELICTASTQGFGLADYWYIMHYDSNESTCNQIWASPQYATKITTLEVVDFNNDKNYKILLCFEDGTIQIFDGKTRELLSVVRPVSEKIYSVVYADADNDSKMEYVISCENNTYVLDANSFSQKFKITQGAKYARVGNIDSDSNNEIVLSSGTAYRISDSTLTTIWRFNLASNGLLELSDIDSDSKQEIIFAEGWQKINVYDVDTKTTKYIITTDLDINALYLNDINNDGVDEILYGDGQWGEVFCYNSVTHAKMWSVNNPEHGVAAINYADLNNDGKQELIWSAGWTSTGADYLYIYNVPDKKLLWRSEDIVGPFYAIATGDVDNDGKDEIVAVSYESESGYGSGVLLIIDAQTNKLKWKSDGNFMYLVWTGIYDVSINDIDNDGQNEIIIAAGQTYTGKIWIIDGKNHLIKSSYIFSSDNISEFYALTVDDVDNDGKQELLAASSSILCAINPSDWAIKWKVSITSSYSKPILRCAELNGDGKKETILCKGAIQIINGSDQSIWTSTETNYINIDTFDFNTDGVLDIVASTTNGHIVTIDGKTKSIIKDVNPETTEISSVRMQKFEGSILYAYSCGGRINFYKNDSSCIVTQMLGNKIGEVEGFKRHELTSDTSSFLIGTSISVLKMSGNLIKCLGLNIDVNMSEVSCDKDDGKIQLNVSGGTFPYKYLWNDRSTLDSITNLKSGNYWVKIQDNESCTITKYFNLPKASIAANLNVIDESCIEKGSAQINISHITAPYSINWSNSDTSLVISNLSAGNYSVSITDAKNCVYEDIAIVQKDTVIVSSFIKNVSCAGKSNGSINLTRISGAIPLTYTWGNGSTSNNINSLKAGIYNVLIVDALGCESNLTFEIDQPDTISYDILVSPDVLSTPNWEGKIIIDNITGGTSPYQIYWPKFSKYSDYIDILPEGKYAFVVNDGNGCVVKDTAVVASIVTGIQDVNIEGFLIYPNPAKNELFINKVSSDINNYSYELINSNGQIVTGNKQLMNDLEKIDLKGLNSGIYFLRLNINNSNYLKKIIKE